MTTSLQILLILSVLGVAQAVLLAVALLRTKRGNLVSNRLLAAFAATIGLAIAGTCLTKLRYSPALYSLGKINQPISFLGAPLLFLYVVSEWSFCGNATIFGNHVERVEKRFRQFLPQMCQIMVPPRSQSSIRQLRLLA
jgi:hypothetical protein